MFDVQDKSWVVETNYHIPENKEPQRKWSKFKAVVFVKKLKTKKLSFILIPRVTRFYASLEVKMTTWPEETRTLRTRSWMRRSIRSFKIPPATLSPLSPTLQSLNFWRLVRSNFWKAFSPPRPKLCSNASPKYRLWLSIFFVNGKINSNRDFLLDLFFWSSDRESEIFTCKHLHIKRQNMFIPLERLNNSNCPPHPGKLQIYHPHGTNG